MALTTDQLKKYWDTANLLRKNLDAAEYKHIVLGLVFLKYVSDSFEERRAELDKQFSDPKSDTYKKDEKRRAEALRERDYYKAVNVFWVPEISRWASIQENSKQPDIAQRVDNALYEVEKENPKLEGIVERRYADAKLPAADLGAVVDLIGSISFGHNKHEASDVLGQVYEYFLGNFANAEGKLGGQFYTTPSIVKTLVEVLQPTKGRVYDPCCGSGGMFVQSEKFVEAHGGKLGNIAIYGQESNPTTRRLCAMNLAIRGIDFDLGKSHGDTFTEDQHPDLRFDYILMNPPFGSNASYPKEQLSGDVRWKKYGVPRERPANYAWMSHAVHHLAPKGRAGIVMPRGTLTSSQGGDDTIRKAFLDDDVIECIIDLPGQLFFNTQIPSSLWFFNKDKSKWKTNRNNQVLFIDARKLGTAISRTQIEFSDAEIARIADTFNSWCDGKYEDIDGFCKSVTREEIAKNSDSLSPGRYIGTEEVESENDEDFTTRMQTLTSQLSEQLEESHRLEALISKQLKGLGYDL
jgi:type I restriction enzyme M protein